jgi:Icc-related predicted phosphoesterase
VTENHTVKKGDLQCRAKSCKRVFHNSDLKIVKTERFGEYKVCPYCGSNTYGLIDYPISVEEQIYKNGKFYLHSGKDIKNRIDKIERNL